MIKIVKNVSRKVGEAMSDAQLQAKSSTELLGELSQFIRNDWGGRDPIDVIASRLEEAFDDGSSVSFRDVAVECLEVVENQRKGIKKRCKRRIEILTDRAKKN